MSGGHAHADHGGNKGVALLISVLALVLAFSETLGKAAQTSAISYNIEASNLWAFYQSKTIRRTILRTAAQEMAVHADSAQAKEVIAGYVMIRAASLDAAAELAKGCPGLAIGLTVEVRPLQDFSPVLEQVKARGPQ